MDWYHPPRQTYNLVIPTHAGMANVNVTVTDPYNRLVSGLETDNFRVFADNVEQEVVTFSVKDVPFSIGAILDFRAA